MKPVDEMGKPAIKKKRKILSREESDLDKLLRLQKRLDDLKPGIEKAFRSIRRSDENK